MLAGQLVRQVSLRCLSPLNKTLLHFFLHINRIYLAFIKYILSVNALYFDICFSLEPQNGNTSDNYLMGIWHNRLYLYSFAALIFGIWLSLKMAIKRVRSPPLL